MPNARVERRLTAILAADVAGYSRLIGEDEEGTLVALRALRRELIDPKIAEHRGRIVKTTGDGLLVEFASVVDALRCASEVQGVMTERNADVAAEKRIEFRVGIHQGDIVVEDGDIFGDGVNVAARLEALAEPGGICVSARVHEDVAGRLNLSFEDMGEQSLKNIARPVRVYRITAPRPSQPHAGETPAVQLALPDKPSIAVLPFQNMSGDPEQEYFADGMVEEIITALSRIRWLFVIARNSSFTYKGQHVDIKQVGRELGVRYVLEGSVRKGGNRVRITAQLIEAETGAHLWADRFDGSLEDVFDLQDQVATSVAGVIEPALRAAETARAASRPTTDLTAYDLYLRASQSFSSLVKEDLQQAAAWLDQAIARDPHYGPALALAAMCQFQLCLNGWVDNPALARTRGLDFARRALTATVDDPFVLASAAVSLPFFGEDWDASIHMMERSLAANPNYAYGWFWSAVLRLIAGEPDTAIEHMDRSLRLNPRDRHGSPLTPIGGAYFFKRDFEKAAPVLRSAILERPHYPMSYRFLAACYAHMGRLDEAREVIARLATLTAIDRPPHMNLRNPADMELLVSGMRLAMAPKP
jgi:TolB-like protein/class 3 adenylate cyclase